VAKSPAKKTLNLDEMANLKAEIEDK
jgi:hypothetical protein